MTNWPSPSDQDLPLRRRVLHLWDVHVGVPTTKRPFSDEDKIAFAHAVLKLDEALLTELRQALWAEHLTGLTLIKGHRDRLLRDLDSRLAGEVIRNA